MASQTTNTRRRKDIKGYMELVRRFPLRPIRNDKELDRAIAVIDALLDREELTLAAQDYLDVLGDLVQRYEDVRDPVNGDKLTEGQMLRFLIDQKDVTQADTARATGIAVSCIS